MHVLFEGRSDADLLLVDSGADVSMAPIQLAKDLSIDLNRGFSLELKGISTNPGCSVKTIVCDVHLRIMPRGWMLRVPFAFAEGDAPLLAGRSGFFENLDVHLKGGQRSTLVKPSD